MQLSTQHHPGKAAFKGTARRTESYAAFLWRNVAIIFSLFVLIIKILCAYMLTVETSEYSKVLRVNKNHS